MEWNGEGARGRDEYEMRSESSPETDCGRCLGDRGRRIAAEGTGRELLSLFSNRAVRSLRGRATWVLSREGLFAKGTRHGGIEFVRDTA